jgi:hypothetical protein
VEVIDFGVLENDFVAGKFKPFENFWVFFGNGTI